MSQSLSPPGYLNKLLQSRFSSVNERLIIRTGHDPMSHALSKVNIKKLVAQNRELCSTVALVLFFGFSVRNDQFPFPGSPCGQTIRVNTF